jgi:hypothetical protein
LILAQNKQLETAAALRTGMLSTHSEDNNDAIWYQSHNLWLCSYCLADIENTLGIQFSQFFEPSHFVL